MDIGGLVKAFFDNAGPGGVVVLLVIGAASTIYYFLTRWIVSGGRSHRPATQDEHTQGTDV
jgi:hypothetical protein